MSCLKVLVIFILAVSNCHGIQHHKELKPSREVVRAKILKYLEEKILEINKIKPKGIQKRDVQSDAPYKVDMAMPAPVVEHIGERKIEETLYGFQKTELTGVPLAQTMGPGLRTNIIQALNPPGLPSPVPGLAGEMYGGLPPPPIGQIPTQSVPLAPTPGHIPIQSGTLGLPQFQENRPFILQGTPVPPPLPPHEVPILPHAVPIPPSAVPIPPNEVPIPPYAVPPPSPEPPMRSKVRQVAVYAGDVILKYLSQFFNRARITFNRFTSPPAPIPEFEK